MYRKYSLVLFVALVAVALQHVNAIHLPSSSFSQLQPLKPKFLIDETPKISTDSDRDYLSDLVERVVS